VRELQAESPLSAITPRSPFAQASPQEGLMISRAKVNSDLLQPCEFHSSTSGAIVRGSQV
jgi:hypothetical protein